MTAKAVFLVDIMGWNMPVASRNPLESQTKRLDGPKSQEVATVLPR